MRRPRALLILALAASAGSGSFGHAQLEERVDVTRIQLDVRAVDGRGRPILGLRSDDFEILVDGRSAAIDSADWVMGALPDRSRLATGHPEADSAGRRIVLLFQRDLHPSRVKGLMRMRDVVADFVADLRPGDEVALVVHDVGLKIYSDFSRDHERIGALLIHARVTMYALDVTDADHHTLEGPLFQAALETGGFYVKTHRFSELAMRRVTHAMSVHYEVAFAAPDGLAPGRHEVRVDLVGRQGATYHKRFFDN